MTANRIEVIKNHLSGVLKLSPNKTSANSYQYTVDNNKLTKFQREFYETNGYILISNLIPHDIIDKCQQHFLDMCYGKVSKGNMILMREILMKDKGATGEYLYNKVQDITTDDIFGLYSDYPELLDYVECFTGPNIVVVHSMLINKPPGTDIHPTHQDLHYFPFRPANRIVAAWTAMESVFVENGCLFMIPGSHNRPLYEHTYPVGKDNIVNKAYHGIVDEDELAAESKRVYVPMHKGDTVFFHPLLIHGSGPNLTKGFRKSISCHYAGGECKYIETKGTMQDDVGKELAQMDRKRGLELDFKMFWHIRSKVVRGKRIDM